MHINDLLLSSDLLLFADFIWLLVLVQAVRSAPWRAFLAHSTRQHVFAGASLGLFLIWSFAVGVRPALGFHFLGVTVYTLMFGWSLGVIGVGLVMVAVTFTTGDWSALALNALLIGVLPVSVSYGIYALVYRYLPHHLFIYIFLCAFFNAMLAAAATVLALVVLLVATETYSFHRISSDYLPFVPLYLFPEGLLNGMTITALIGVRPDWLKTYDDAIYLKG
ncbi:MAG: energy-coupling factor ABC transporter permease [Candidatus Competibacteraceae bacterium]|uniref:Integral membrane protein n=1 Tax=Candidatus Contendobacter odensis Run_B_J11 TaxID=1400861 RepID=A0A7U7GA31_9GAMM|nr:energy-coupling factor ABC transporter permease [Candidatus Contendobacter odensis]MBK8534810.1 energy-coupling factor ABC transporter permease [Candidatus Competibacteraceae bacterium]CDH44441.1 putative integral membrane protein [Candidatus Contendobacter odensis Run_B_J11]